jgi:hypothetical protein
MQGKNVSIIPWADMTPNPDLVVWLDRERPATGERKVPATHQDELDRFKSRGLTGVLST